MQSMLRAPKKLEIMVEDMLPITSKMNAKQRDTHSIKEDKDITAMAKDISTSPYLKGISKGHGRSGLDLDFLKPYRFTVV